MTSTMGTLDDLFRMLDGVALPETGIALRADETIVAVRRAVAQGDGERALDLLDVAILDARRARRAAALGAGSFASGGFDIDGYLVELHLRRAALTGDRRDYVAAHVVIPDHPSTRPMLVEVYENLGRPDLAVSLMTRLYRENPDGFGHALTLLVANLRQAGVRAAVVEPALRALGARDDCLGTRDD